MKQNILASCRDSDSAVNECMKSAIKDLNTLLNKIRGKGKSLKRRQDKGEYPRKFFDEMIAELVRCHQIATKLSNSAGETGIITELRDIESTLHVNVSMATFKGASSGEVIAHLKFSDWKSFTDLRQCMMDVLGCTNGGNHFELMTSELMQRLLRALPTKVS